MIDINMLRTMKYHWRVLALAMGVALVLIFQIARYVKYEQNNVWPQLGCNLEYLRSTSNNGAAQLAYEALRMDSETSILDGDGRGRTTVFSNIEWKSKFIR